MAGLFIGFLVEKWVPFQSRKSHFGWHRLRFSPCSICKRVSKSQAILALLDSFQELHLECIPFHIRIQENTKQAHSSSFVTYFMISVTDGNLLTHAEM